MDGGKNIVDIFKKWPQYKGPTGCQLIDIDFNIMNKHGSSLLDWDEKLNKILNYIKDNVKFRDPYMKDVLDCVIADGCEKDINALKLLWCLHGYLYTTKKCMSTNNCGKRSMASTQ
ncbi:uncharacterized protein [Musca autumnalis]|uniref:uncharacterized protein n=1 Tax=Musca autumnalis TaxID=221902 RepID=UPI003CF2D7AF